MLLCQQGPIIKKEASSRRRAGEEIGEGGGRYEVSDPGMQYPDRAAGKERGSVPTQLTIFGVNEPPQETPYSKLVSQVAFGSVKAGLGKASIVGRGF